jgi:hypothetical protein
MGKEDRLMSSIRKRYRDRLVVSAGGNAATDPVAAIPSPSDLIPSPVADAPQAPEPLEQENAVAQAAHNAIKQRLAEQEHAEAIAAQPRPEPPQAGEPPPEITPQIVEAMISNSGLPERAKSWLRRNPTYVSDPEKARAIQSAHWLARHRAGSEFSDAYFAHIESFLGLRQEETPTPQPAPPQYTAPPQFTPPAPSPRPQAPPVSAPISRESLSWSSGRPTNSRMPLTGEEIDIAQTLGLDPQEYARQKEKLQRLKAAGAIQ